MDIPEAKITFDGSPIFSNRQSDLSIDAPSRGATGSALKKLNARLSPALRLKKSGKINEEIYEARYAYNKPRAGPDAAHSKVCNTVNAPSCSITSPLSSSFIAYILF